jgi:hypothetical protein
MSLTSYLFVLYLSLAAVCIIVGVILTWVNGHKQAPRPKECSPHDQFPRERHYCKQCGWTTRPVHLYTRSGFSQMSRSVSLCSQCVERVNQKQTIMVPFVLTLPRL